MQSFKALPQKIRKNALSKALLKVGRNAVKIAKKAAPKDTGNLRKHIKFKRIAIGKDEVGVLVYVQKERKVNSRGLQWARSKKRYITASGKVSAYYAYFVEHGTARTKPRPFIAPARAWAEANAQKIIDKEISELILREGFA